MSFAPANLKISPQKINSASTSQLSQQKRTAYQDSPGSYRDLQMSSNDLNANGSLQNRLEIIESHLNRVVNQHDALMPLLSLLETVPKINSNEQTMKQMQKKIDDLETKIQSLEKSCNSKNNQQVFVQIERNFKNTSQQISDMKSNMKEIEKNLTNNSLIIQSKLREEANQVYRNVDIRIDRNKKDIQNLLADFKNSISLSLKRQEDIQHVKGDQGVDVVGFQRNLNDKVDGCMEIVQKQYERDTSNLYREVGMLRSELELFYDKGRRAYIFNEISQFPQNLEQDEKKIAIANLEQSAFFEDIERFDKENQERLVYELDCLEDKISQMNYLRMNGKTQSDVKKDINYIEDSFFSLKNQIHGSKKKYLIDVRKIEDRLEKLIIMKDQQLEKFNHQKMPSHVQQNIQEISRYPQRIRQINDSIDTNVELLQVRQREIEEKLNILKNIKS